MEHIIEQNGNLTFKVSGDDDLQVLKDIKTRVEGDDVAFLAEMLEAFGFSGNGVFVTILPFQVGALTDSPMLSNGTDQLEDGQTVVYGDVWWFPNYQVEDFSDTLIAKGQVTFTKGEREKVTLRQLTKMQKHFFWTYLPRIFHGEEGEALKKMSKEDFIAKIENMSFDDEFPCGLGKCQEAEGLHKKGIFSALKIYKDALGGMYIYLKLSRVSAELLYEMHMKESKK